MKRGVEQIDPEMSRLINNESRRQADTLMMIPSENYASVAVREAAGSTLMNKYAEGYPGRRYYQGQRFTDQVEELVRTRARELFRVPHVNVQPHSGSPANFAIFTALLEPGDRLMGLEIADGGHLTHGARVSASSRYFESRSYGVGSDAVIDLNQVEDEVRKFKPRMLIAGGSAYPRIFDWKGFSEIAERNGAFFMVDMSHYAGLVVADAYPSPVPWAHIIMTTTHKTLRGPRGAMILTTEKGLVKDPQMADKIDKAVFPGLQGGPHMHTIAAIGIALHEAAQPNFRKYGELVVQNAARLARVMAGGELDLVSGGTDTHLILVDLQRLDLTGNTVAEGLESAGIVVNRNSIPHDEKGTAFYPSAIRLGTPALTSRGMGWNEMAQVGRMINDVITGLVRSKSDLNLTREDERKLASRNAIIQAVGCIPEIRRSVLALCDRFPIKDTY